MSQQQPCQILAAVFSMTYVEEMWKRIRTVRKPIPDVGIKVNIRGRKAGEPHVIRDVLGYVG